MYISYDEVVLFVFTALKCVAWLCCQFVALLEHCLPMMAFALVSGLEPYTESHDILFSVLLM